MTKCKHWYTRSQKYLLKNCCKVLVRSDSNLFFWIYGNFGHIKKKISYVNVNLVTAPPKHVYFQKVCLFLLCIAPISLS